MTATILRWTGLFFSALLILLILGVGFGTSPSEARRMREFADAVMSWQKNPDFRQAQVQYVEIGNEALRSKVCFMQAHEVVLWLRSLPGLPEHLQIAPTSKPHYYNFVQGPLSAYQFLSAEQGLEHTVEMLPKLAKNNPITDEHIREFLGSYKLHIPVVSDEGARNSIRRLVADIEPTKPFLPIQTGPEVSERLRPHIARMAAAKGLPTEVKDMTPDQQMLIWRELDGYVKQHDTELWRVKQINDFLCGIWGQVYGTIYSDSIYPFLKVRAWCQWVGPLLLIAYVAMIVWQLKRRPIPPHGGSPISGSPARAAG